MGKLKSFHQIAMVVIFFAYAKQGISQVGIGTTTPNQSAILDVSNNSKGLLIPRMTEVQRDAINFPATGLILFQTDGTSGFYYNSGTPGLPEWTNLLTGNATYWNLTGNSGTDPAINFIGTIDNQPILFKVNSFNSGLIDYSKNLVFFGVESGKSNSTGYSNIGIGANALMNNTFGHNLIAVGDSALYSQTNSTSINTAIGSKALFSNTTGNANTAIGYNALKNNTGGTGNLAVGSQALQANISGNGNTGVGNNSMALGAAGSNNTAIGNFSFFLGGGNQNVAIGAEALYHNSNNWNTVIGYQAAYLNSSGYANTVIGNSAFQNNNSGAENTAVGYNALSGNSTGSGNIAIGSYSFISNQTGISNTIVGTQAGSNSVSGNYNTALGYAASGTDGLSNTVSLGYAAFVTSSNTIVLGNSSISNLRCNTQTISSLSDERFKKNIAEGVHGLDFIMKLVPLTYNLDVKKLNDFNYSVNNKQLFSGKFWDESIRKKESILYSGFSAQQVEIAAQSVGYNFSGLVKPENKNDTYSLSYSEFVVPLVKAVQELSSENSKLVVEQLKLEKEIEVLKKEIEYLKLKK